jgi:hypothetical protein
MRERASERERERERERLRNLPKSKELLSVAASQPNGNIHTGSYPPLPPTPKVTECSWKRKASSVIK